MARYPIDTFSLQFVDEYATLQVFNDDGIEASFDLTDNEDAVQVFVSDGEYDLTTGHTVVVAHRYDIDTGATAGFNGNRLGGIGLVDLRDSGRVGNFTVEYPLESCKVLIATAPTGPKRLMIQAICYTVSES